MASAFRRHEVVKRAGERWIVTSAPLFPSPLVVNKIANEWCETLHPQVRGQRAAAAAHIRRCLLADLGVAKRWTRSTRPAAKGDDNEEDIVVPIVAHSRRNVAFMCSACRHDRCGRLVVLSSRRLVVLWLALSSCRLVVLVDLALVPSLSSSVSSSSSSSTSSSSPSSSSSSPSPSSSPSSSSTSSSSSSHRLRLRPA